MSNKIAARFKTTLTSGGVTSKIKPARSVNRFIDGAKTLGKETFGPSVSAAKGVGGAMKGLSNIAGKATKLVGKVVKKHPLIGGAALLAGGGMLANKGVKSLIKSQGGLGEHRNYRNMTSNRILAGRLSPSNLSGIDMRKLSSLGLALHALNFSTLPSEIKESRKKVQLKPKNKFKFNTGASTMQPKTY